MKKDKPAQVFSLTAHVPSSSETLDSSSTLELPSSLREHFEKTKDFEWMEDSPIKNQLSQNSASDPSICSKENPSKTGSGSLLLFGESRECPLVTVHSDYALEQPGGEAGLEKRGGGKPSMSYLDPSDIFYRKNIFDNHLERIIEEVSNEALSSFFNKSTVFMNSSLQKPQREGLQGSRDNVSREGFLSLHPT